jgi:hypothetical protein
MHRWTKIILKNKALQEEKLSKETHTQTQRAAENTQKRQKQRRKKSQSEILLRALFLEISSNSVQF